MIVIINKYKIALTIVSLAISFLGFHSLAANNNNENNVINIEITVEKLEENLSSSSNEVTHLISETIENERMLEESNNASMLVVNEYREQKRIEEERIKAEEEARQIEEERIQSIRNSNRWSIYLTNEEKDLLAKIVWVEARGESDEGQQAVIEVIFNRMIHPQYKGSLYDVLSSKGQFCSWKLKNTATPEHINYDNIEKVINGETSILSTQAVYFSTFPRNNNNVKVIGNHYFCEY